MSARNPWQEKKPVRSIPQRQESFCIFTEGETEKNYFFDFGLRSVRIRCLGGGGVRHLVSEAKCYMKQEKYSDFDHYWLVFDKDNNSASDIQKALSTAKKNKISWCFSNPCFEIWLLLHFVYFLTSTTSQDLKTRIVPQYIPGYEETMSGIADLLKDKQGDAIRNSRKLWPKRERSPLAKQLYNNLPSTNVDDLVCALNSYSI